MAGEPPRERSEAIRFATKAITDRSVAYRLGSLAVFGLIVAAAIADAITLIPLAGNFVGPIYWVLVSIFLYFKGFGLLNARRFATTLISMIAELIPVVQEFPLILAGTVLVIIFSRLEDKLGTKLSTSKDAMTGGPLNQGGIRLPEREQTAAPGPASTPRQPLNVDGVRQPRAANGDNRQNPEWDS